MWLPVLPHSKAAGLPKRKILKEERPKMSQMSHSIDWSSHRASPELHGEE
jgi:hypothetical protein